MLTKPANNWDLRTNMKGRNVQNFVSSEQGNVTVTIKPGLNEEVLINCLKMKSNRTDNCGTDQTLPGEFHLILVTGNYMQPTVIFSVFIFN